MREVKRSELARLYFGVDKGNMPDLPTNQVLEAANLPPTKRKPINLIQASL